MYTLLEYMKRSIRTTLLVTVLLAGVLARMWCLHLKENVYGDEMTSFALALCQRGWGDRTFKVGHIYTGDELMHTFFTDDRGGMAGLWHDVKLLWHDNIDEPHARLYYMLLRCALCALQPTMQSAIRCEGALNIVFYLFTFLAMLCLMRLLVREKILSERASLLLLLIVAVNPASLSLSVLAREYALAECLFAWWTWWMLRSLARLDAVHGADIPYAWFAVGSVLSALFLSAGYLNGIYLTFTGAVLMWHAIRKHRWGTATGMVLTGGISAVQKKILRAVLLHCIRFALSFHKTGGISAVQKEILTAFLLHCVRFALSL